MRDVEFFTGGTAAPEGSMIGYTIAGHVNIVASNKKALEAWRSDIHTAAAEVAHELFQGPVVVEATFLVKRPISTPKWKLWVQTSPDLDKYARALLDAMTGVVYRDDGQVARLAVEKVYADPGQQFGVRVVVREIIEERLLAKKSQMPLGDAAMSLGEA